MFDFSSLVEGASSGAIAGSSVPCVGTVAGGIVGAVTSLFGGGHGVPNHEDGDAGIIAAAVGITVQQAKDLCAMVEDEAGKGGPNFDDIVKDYASHPQEIVGLIPRYNRKHPEKPIYVQQMSSLGTSAIETMQPVQPTQVQSGLSTTTVAAQIPLVSQGQFVANGSHTADASASGSPDKKEDHTTTYALIGGGAFAVIIVLILLLKK